MKIKPKQIKLETRLGICFAVLTAVIAMLLFSLLVMVSYRQANQDFRMHLRNIVGMAALRIDGDAHASLVSPDQENSPLYIRLKNKLQQIRHTVTYDIKYIYTWRFDADGKLVFVLDTATTSEEISHIGDIYQDADLRLLTILSDMDRPVTEKDFVTDKWGTCLSAYAPIFTSDGRREGILGIDVSASSIVDYRKRYLLKMACIFLVVLPLSVFLGGFTGRTIAKPIVKLRLAAQQITQGNLDYKLDIHSDDEVGQLATSFYDMTTQLKTLIKNLHQRSVLRQEVNAIGQSLLKMSPIEERLKGITDAVVKLFGAEFCRIWLIRPGDKCRQGCIYAEVREGPYVCRSSEKCLHLAASSGCDTPQDRAKYDRVPFGCYKMGRIASGQEHKFLTNDIQNDPQIHDHQWARQLGLMSSAGYQLKVEGGQTLGVMVLFSKRPIQDSEDAILDGISTSVALAVQEFVTAQSVRESEEKYRNLFEGSRDAIFISEPPEWKFTSVNQAGVELFAAYSREALLSMKPEDLSPQYQPDGSLSAEMAEKLVQIAIEEGGNSFEWTHKKLNGQEFQAAVLLARMEHNGRLSIQSTCRDITPQKKAQSELIKTNQSLEQANSNLRDMQSQIIQNEKLAAIGQLAAGVAHEMNNPIGFVASNFETLENYMDKFKKVISMYEELGEEIQKSAVDVLISKTKMIEDVWKDLKMDFVFEDVQSLFEESKEGLSRTTKIIQSLRDFSRIDQVTDIGEFDLNEGIQDTLIVAKNEIKYDCEIKTQLSQLPVLLCNPGQINQVILNIVVNAAQAIKSQARSSKGTISIKTYIDQEQVVCEIADDGPGIPQEILTKIFDPFFTTKPVGKGTGLGLSISRDIIAKHKGELRVDSIAGKGSKFTIKLPISFEFPEPKEELIEEAAGEFT
jgi:PAS domain S-box-containing protein